jgi:hypothetical protein
MTDQEKRIAIAEACGWGFYPVGPNEYEWLKPHPDDAIDSNPRMLRHQEVPDYLNDLNAMHEAEYHIEDMERYYCNLAAIVSKWKKCWKVSEADHIAVFMATAAERAEAFLLTIKENNQNT